MKLGTIDQSLILFLIMIFGFPVAAKFSNGYGKVFMFLMGILTILVGLFIFLILFKKWVERDKDNYNIASFYFEVFIAYALFYAFAVVAAPSGSFVSGLFDICSGCSNYSEVNFWFIAD